MRIEDLAEMFLRLGVVKFRKNENVISKDRFKKFSYYIDVFDWENSGSGEEIRLLKLKNNKKL